MAKQKDIERSRNHAATLRDKTIITTVKRK